MAHQESQQATVKLTSNFERNLNEIEAFLTEAEAPQAFAALLDELTDIVIPNLECFPAMGRSFLSRSIRSVETSNGIDIVQGKLASLGENSELREYVLQHDLMLYARVGSVIYLLTIRHHQQLSFDFQNFWSAS